LIWEIPLSIQFAGPFLFAAAQDVINAATNVGVVGIDPDR